MGQIFFKKKVLDCLGLYLTTVPLQPRWVSSPLRVIMLGAGQSNHFIIIVIIIIIINVVVSV